MTRALPLALVLAFAGAILPAPRLVAQAPQRALPPGAERAYRALSANFDGESALDVVRFMAERWRLAGNPGFNESIDRLRAGLQEAGFGRDAGATLRIDQFDPGTRGWDYRTGTVAFADTGEVVLSKERDRVSLAINSFSTPAGGVRARLIDVGKGAAADYQAHDLRGAIVLGDASLRSLWTEAVSKRGALGVISTEIAPYIRPGDPGAMSEAQKDVLQWGGVPYNAALKKFGFKASWRAASRMRERLRASAVEVRVEIESSFYTSPTRTLVAEIPGRAQPSERIALVAHVQEPGANDNASGCGTLYALARALRAAIASGALAAPHRTITFMWVDEIRGTREWIRSRPEEARGVRYMMALDMTGEDTSKTGGTFLIEKQPDPSAVWGRPSDPHTEWGGGEAEESSLKGSLLNDLHLAVCLRRAHDTGWVVKTNPYEGGSDHTVFGATGVPSLLNWHFTDRFYHSNQDTADKTSAAEMANVGIATGTSAWLLASANSSDASALVDLIASAADRRLALEREQGKALVAAAADRAAAEAVEQRVIAAWIKWYREALESVLALPVAGADASLRAKVAGAAGRLR